MIIRAATEADAHGIAVVHVNTWLTTYRGIVPDEHLASLSVLSSEERWRRNLSSAQTASVYAVAEVEDVASAMADQPGPQVVGFVAAGPERSDDPLYRGEVYALYVLQAHHGKGTGRALVKWAAAALRDRGYPSMLIWVLAENPSRRFYERIGGTYVRETTINIGGADLVEAAYGWSSLEAFF